MARYECVGQKGRGTEKGENYKIPKVQQMLDFGANYHDSMDDFMVFCRSQHDDWQGLVLMLIRILHILRGLL